MAARGSGMESCGNARASAGSPASTPAATTPRTRGEINDYQPSDYFPPHKLKRLDRYAQFALVLTRQALEDAGLQLDPEHPRSDVGVSFGTALGGITTAELTHEKFVRENNHGIPAALALQVFGGSGHSNIAIAYGMRGYGTTNSNSCASGTVAVGEAFRVIREGRASVMVAGAAEAPLASLTFGAFDTIKSMSKELKDPQRAVRPFDSTRTGFVMSKAAAASSSSRSSTPGRAAPTSTRRCSATPSTTTPTT